MIHDSALSQTFHLLKLAMEKQVELGGATPADGLTLNVLVFIAEALADIRGILEMNQEQPKEKRQ